MSQNVFVWTLANLKIFMSKSTKFSVLKQMNMTLHIQNGLFIQTFIVVYLLWITLHWWITCLTSDIHWLTMTSSNGNIFRVTGPLWGEFTGPGEFPAQWPVTRSFDVFLICVWINDWVNNREAGDLRRHRGHYDVNTMKPGIYLELGMAIIWTRRPNFRANMMRRHW